MWVPLTTFWPGEWLFTTKIIEDLIAALKLFRGRPEKHRTRGRNHEDALNDKETFEVVQEEDVNRGYYGLLWERSDAP